MFEKQVTTRRLFLQRGLTLLAIAPTIPTFLDQTIMALADPLDTPRVARPSGKDGKILVVVQLSGGNDGLNTVIPYADDAYHRVRPTLGVDPRTVLKIDNYIGLHPDLAPLKNLYDSGCMSVLQGVGYPNPNRSHFRAMDIWQTGIPERDLVTTGWIGRYFDNTCSGSDPHVGVAMGDQLPLAMQGERVTPLAFERPESYRYNGSDKDAYLALNRAIAAAPPTTAPAKGTPSPHVSAESTANSQLDFLHRTAMDAQMSSDEILGMTRRHTPAGKYPNGSFGNGLRTVAAMIGGGLSTRVYYVSLGGFDTHAGEKGRHDRLMKELAEGIAAFYADLKSQKNDDRVLTMTFSEFGRRVAQNASGGTDHGTAAPMFMFGAGLRQGVVGRHPSLTNLDQGDLRYGIDFRGVYAEVLQNWLETPSKPVLGQQFKPLPFLKA